MKPTGRPRRAQVARSCSLGFLAASLVWVSGCQTLMTAGREEVSAVYQGTLTLDGGEVQAALEITPRGGGAVLGGLQTGSGLVADGEGGTRRGDRLVLTFRYGGSCPGTLTLDGKWDKGEGRYAGDATAEDCTGRALGTFDLVRPGTRIDGSYPVAH